MTVVPVESEKKTVKSFMNSTLTRQNELMYMNNGKSRRDSKSKNIA